MQFLQKVSTAARSLSALTELLGENFTIASFMDRRVHLPKSIWCSSYLIVLRTADLLCNAGEHLFRQIHQICVVAVGLIELEHRELRIVPCGYSFIPEDAIQVVNAIQAADNQPLQIQFRRDPQIQRHVERVVMRPERLRQGAAGDRMQNRRFDFEIAAFVEKAHAVRE